MENSYGIGVANRYALFLDDDADPLEVLKVQELEKEQKKKSKVAAEKENKVKSDVPPKVKPAPTGTRKLIKDTPVVTKVVTEKREQPETKKNGPPRNNDSRNERSVKFSGENREERNNRRNRDDKPFNGAVDSGSNRFNRDDRPPRRNDNRTPGENDLNEAGQRGGRGGAGGRGDSNRPRQPRGDGPRRNFENRGNKREFDRQSGSDKTGIKPIDKRDGAGAHNWGSHKDDIDEISKTNDIDLSWDNEKSDSGNNATTDQLKDDTATAPVNDGDAPASAADAPAVPVAPEEEVRELTLDEWKAQRAAGRQKPQYNLRKAGEGEDLTQWKKMYALNKKKEKEEDDETDEEEYDVSAEYPQRVGRQKHVLDIEVRFSDSRRGGMPGGRSRGGPRGGRGGGDRGDRPDRGAPAGKERKPFRNNDEQAADDTPGVERERPERGDRPDRGDRGERGERGGDRGERGGGDRGNDRRGGDRTEKANPRQGGNVRQSAPKVDDEHDFPSLG